LFTLVGNNLCFHTPPSLVFIVERVAFRVRCLWYC
jgi:hypothetical protein